jgi:hypothetical protein
MAIGALLLAVLVGLLVFFLVPRCSEALTPQSDSRNAAGSNGLPYNTPSTLPEVSDGSLSKVFNSPSVWSDDVDERLPRSIEPTHYRSVQVATQKTRFSLTIIAQNYQTRTTQ